MTDDSPHSTSTTLAQIGAPEALKLFQSDVLQGDNEIDNMADDNSNKDLDEDLCSQCSYTSDDISCLTEFSAPLCDIEQPGLNDVIFCKSSSYPHKGSSSSQQKHPGNRRFRSLLEEYQRLYRTAPEGEKPFVAAAVVRIWRSLDRPGRFLTPGADGRWYDVGDRHAIDRTSHCLSADDATLSTVGGSMSWNSGDDSSRDAHVDEDQQDHEHYVSLMAFRRKKRRVNDCFLLVGGVLRNIFVSCFENQSKEGIWVLP